MLITFKSKAAAEVMMYEKHAKRILDLLGKDVERGIITPEESATAIAKLEAEIAESKAEPVSEDAEQDINGQNGTKDDDYGQQKPEPVTFATRAYPLLEMLRAAHRAGTHVMWGV